MFPERVVYPPRSQATEPYAEYLKKRFQEGCRNAALLYREIKAQGYRGGSATVRRLLRSWEAQLPIRYQRLESLRTVTVWRFEIKKLRPRAAWYLASNKCL
jgi:hypothetical protein